MIGLSLTTFLYVQLYMEMLAMFGFGAIFLRMCSLFFRAMSQLTNQLDLYMILLIFSICFFFIYSFPQLRIFLFSLSSFIGLLRVFERELLFAFFTGESLRESVNGLILFIFGKILTFSVERIVAFFESISLRMDSQRELSSTSPINFSSFLRQLNNCGNLSLLFLSSTHMAKMKPRLYLSIRFQTILFSYFQRKSLLFFFKVAAWSKICPSAIQSSYFFISVLFLLKQQIFSLDSTSQSLSLISSSCVTRMFAGESAPCIMLFWWRAAMQSMTGKKVLHISYQLKCMMLYPRMRFSIYVYRLDFSLAYSSPLLQRIGLSRFGCEMLHSVLVPGAGQKYWQTCLVGLCRRRISLCQNFIMTNYLPDALIDQNRIYFVYYISINSYLIQTHTIKNYIISIKLLQGAFVQHRKKNFCREMLQNQEKRERWGKKQWQLL